MSKQHDSWFWDWIVPALVMLGIVLAMWFLPREAKAQELSKGVLCDEERQIEEVATHFLTGIPINDAIKAVNTQANSMACGEVTFLSASVETIKVITVSGRGVTILKLHVVLVYVPTPFGIVPQAVDIVQYGAVPVPVKPSVQL